RDGAEREQRANGGNRPLVVHRVRHTHHPARDHDGDRDQDGDRADVHEYLYDRQERRLQCDEQPGDAEQRQDQVQCGVQQVAAEHNAKTATQREDSENAKRDGQGRDFHAGSSNSYLAAPAAGRSIGAISIAASRSRSRRPWRMTQPTAAAPTSTLTISRTAARGSRSTNPPTAA